MSLADDIANEVEALAFDYPKGATLSDIAGYFGAPLAEVEHAIRWLKARGVGLPFLIEAQTKDPAAVRMGKRGGAARAKTQSKKERSELARLAAQARWGAPVEAGSRTGRESKETASPTTDDVMHMLRIAQHRLALAFPHGGNARELAEFLNVPQGRMYSAIKQAERDGWCEQITSYGDSNSGRVAVFEGMLCPAPQLTKMQVDVLEWIRKHAKADGSCEVPLNRCAAELGFAQINDKLDSMERKGYLARMTPYQYNGKLKGSPMYKLLPSPGDRKPELFTSKTAPDLLTAFAIDIDERGMDAICAEPIAVRRARERRIMIEAELKEIEAFLSTYDRLSK